MLHGSGRLVNNRSCIAVSAADAAKFGSGDTGNRTVEGQCRISPSCNTCDRTGMMQSTLKHCTCVGKLKNTAGVVVYFTAENHISGIFPEGDGTVVTELAMEAVGVDPGLIQICGISTGNIDLKICTGFDFVFDAFRGPGTVLGIFITLGVFVQPERTGGDSDGTAVDQTVGPLCPGSISFAAVEVVDMGNITALQIKNQISCRMVVNIEHDLGILNGQSTVVVQLFDLDTLIQCDLALVNDLGEFRIQCVFTDNQIGGTAISIGTDRNRTAIISLTEEFQGSVHGNVSVEAVTDGIEVLKFHRGILLNGEGRSVGLFFGILCQITEFEFSARNNDVGFIAIKRTCDRKIRVDRFVSGSLDVEIMISTAENHLLGLSSLVVDSTAHCTGGKLGITAGFTKERQLMIVVSAGITGSDTVIDLDRIMKHRIAHDCFIFDRNAVERKRIEIADHIVKFSIVAGE